MQAELDALLASGSGDETFGSAQHDEYFRVLMLALWGASLVKRHENSGSLEDLEEGINSLSRVNRFIPDNHPTKLDVLVTSETPSFVGFSV